MTERLSDAELLDLCGKWATEDATKMRRPSVESVALTELVDRRQQDAWRPIEDDDLHDLVSDAISDSIDMDWTCTMGARSVVAALKEAGAVVSIPSSPEPQ